MWMDALGKQVPCFDSLGNALGKQVSCFDSLGNALDRVLQVDEGTGDREIV